MVKYLVTAQLTRQFPNKTITRLLFVSADNENVFFQYDDNNPAEQIQIPLATIWRYEDRLTASGFRPNVTGYLTVDSQFPAGAFFVIQSCESSRAPDKWRTAAPP